MTEPTINDGFSHLVRAAIAILLTLTLPFVLYIDSTRDSTVVQVYLDALAAVVAFYFGSSVSKG